MENEDYNAETDVPLYNRLLSECLNKRQMAYMVELGGWHQQFDMIFHDFEGWKAKIQSIKDRFPKPVQSAEEQ